MTTKLTDHFTLEEFIHHDQRGWDQLTAAAKTKFREELRRLARALEEIRTAGGDKPILITSGWRSPMHNTNVGGVPNSDHQYGWACDFRVATVNVSTTFALVRTMNERDGFAFDQLILYPRHLHISVGRRARGQAFAKI